MTELIIVGDEAYSVEEWEAEQRRLAADRERAAEHRLTPERREYMRAYQLLPQRRAYKREWARRNRGSTATVVGSLHDLSCTGPTRRTGCRCQKIPMYRKDA